MRKLRYIIIGITGFLILSFSLISVSRVVFRNKDRAETIFGKPITEAIFQSSELIKTGMMVFQTPNFFVANDTIQNGFRYYIKDQQYPKLLTSFLTNPDTQTIELLDLNSGKRIKSWTLDLSYLDRESLHPNNQWKNEIGPNPFCSYFVMLSDSSLVFSNRQAVFRIDADGEIIWMNNNFIPHHSIELGEDELLYISSRDYFSREYDFLPDEHEYYKNRLLDDAMTILDPEDGSIIFQKTIIEILTENKLEHLIYESGGIISDPIHLNDVQPALGNGDYWEKGDVLLSLRNMSMILLYRPSTHKVLWYQRGPWLNQHDPDFIGVDKISVYGNDFIDHNLWTSEIDKPISPHLMHSLRGFNDIYLYDFSKDTITKPYTSFMQSAGINTPTGGQQEIFENGDIYVLNSVNGIIHIGDSLTQKVTIANRIDENHISNITWGKILK